MVEGCLHVPSCVFIYTASLQPSGVCLHLLYTDQLGQTKRWRPLSPPWTLGPGVAFASQEKNVQAPTGRSNTWKALVLQRAVGWRMITLDALHLSL